MNDLLSRAREEIILLKWMVDSGTPLDDKERAEINKLVQEIDKSITAQESNEKLSHAAESERGQH